MDSNVETDITEDTLERLLELVHEHTGITMSVNKRTMLQGRLRARLRVLGLASYSDYVSHLEKHLDEIQEFVNLVTTNETSFFRTQRVWDFFTEEFMPAWFGKNSRTPLRIWSAAASSGEEPYTIAICCEEFKAKVPAFSYQIVGSDISTGALASAERGEYQGRSIEGFKSANRRVFDRYLAPVGEGFRVVDTLRTKIRFLRHNLFDQYVAPNSFDIVFLRNVLIYFEPADQERVLGNIARALVGDGTLVIGESESLNALKTPFHFVSPLVYLNRKGA